MPQEAQLIFAEINAGLEADAVATFLVSSTWPFHALPVLTPAQAREIRLGPPSEIRSFWIFENRVPAGLIRVFDLEDAAHGSVLFDLRMADEFRGRGIGRAAVAWLVTTLFTEYPLLHRIEANTRFDNRAMRRVLETCGFVLEGMLRQTWRGADGTRHDTALYGRLRSDS